MAQTQEDIDLENAVAPDVPPNSQTTSTVTVSQPKDDGSLTTATATVSIDNTEKPTIRWNNRRQMAWCAFWAMIIMTLVLWFAVPLFLPIGMITIVSESMGSFYFAMTAVILAYMGFTTIPFIGKNAQKVNINQSDY